MGKMRKSGVNGIPIQVHIGNWFGAATMAAAGAVTGGVTHVEVEPGFLGSEQPVSLPAIEQLVPVLEFMYGISTGIKVEKLFDYVSFVAKRAKIPRNPVEPIVGQDIWTHERPNMVVSVLKGSDKYIRNPAMQPEAVGRKHSVAWSRKTVGSDQPIRTKLQGMKLKGSEKQVKEIMSIVRRRVAALNNYPWWLSESEVEKICRDVVKAR